MAADSDSPGKKGELQFDKVETVGGGTAGPGGGLVCSNCGKPIESVYYQLALQPLCPACKGGLEASLQAGRARGSGVAGMTKALLFGLGAAIAGAVVYFAIAKLTGLEIGLVAILIGWMVGYSVRKASGGFGGRRFQVIAVTFTYLSVGLAYASFSLLEIAKRAETRRGASAEQHAPAKIVLSDSAPAMVANGDSGTVDGATDNSASGAVREPAAKRSGSPAGALAAVALLVLVLPVAANIAAMPSGLLGLLIIGFGLMQAWRMTAGFNLEFKGPFRVAAPPAPPAPPPAPAP